MERRTIQKVGGSTLSVSLPKDWANFAGVKQGNTVYLVQERNGALRILSDNMIEKEANPREFFINCDLTKEPNLMERLIIGSYVLGNDVIRISSSTRIGGEQLEEIRNIVRKIVGLDIIEESQREIILQCFIDPLKFEIRSLIQRLSVIASTMLNEAMEALLELSPELAEDVIKREDEANNIFWLITRLIILTQRSQTFADKMDFPFGPIGLRLVSENLEGIADCCESIAKIVLEVHRIMDGIDKKDLKELSTLDELTKEVFRKSVDSLFSGNIITANDAINLRDRLEAEVEAQMRKAILPYHRAIAVMMAIIADNCSTIATVAINIHICRSNSFSPST